MRTLVLLEKTSFIVPQAGDKHNTTQGAIHRLEDRHENRLVVSLNDLLHNDGDRECRGLVHPLLVYITQVTARSVHHIPDGGFLE
jgi:hypothetical protein